MSKDFPGVAAQGMNMMATAPMVCFTDTHLVLFMQTMQRLGLAATDTVYIHLNTTVDFATSTINIETESTASAVRGPRV